MCFGHYRHRRRKERRLHHQLFLSFFFLVSVFCIFHSIRQSVLAGWPVLYSSQRQAAHEVNPRAGIPRCSPPMEVECKRTGEARDKWLASNYTEGVYAVRSVGAYIRACIHHLMATHEPSSSIAFCRQRADTGARIAAYRQLTRFRVCWTAFRVESLMMYIQSPRGCDTDCASELQLL